MANGQGKGASGKRLRGIWFDIKGGGNPAKLTWQTLVELDWQSRDKTQSRNGLMRA